MRIVLRICSMNCMEIWRRSYPGRPPLKCKPYFSAWNRLRVFFIEFETRKQKKSKRRQQRHFPSPSRRLYTTSTYVLVFVLRWSHHPQDSEPSDRRFYLLTIIWRERSMSCAILLNPSLWLSFPHYPTCNVSSIASASWAGVVVDKSALFTLCHDERPCT